MGKLRNYEDSLRDALGRLKRLRSYNGSLIQGVDLEMPETHLVCEMPNIGVSQDTHLNLFEPRKARDYLRWINEDFVKGLIRDIEGVLEKEERKKEGKEIFGKVRTETKTCFNPCNELSTDRESL